MFYPKTTILSSIYSFTDCAAEDWSATLVEITHELGDLPFGFEYWNEGRFIPICSFLRLSVYASTKTSNT
ncbi:hypothetical protein H5410_060777 [Solanum commersonii]|uniref:Uncharacterized protein n=1 Tax=Solanum commersonii TaxID=4109 RepID=A0A9J5W5Y7_SOLCO|nr:hypothetical protein H5410_060777 [Solanum commersonii]